ncbi:dephospho-CoA kinase [Virgibacillus sp. AGTR]|uniref:Dephospho-CoA kinase n=1 Tax=Virgibacillus salarius TaxID=447199 RepID=A0A941DYP2_9BACI|nr:MULTISPECIES: dephospho-CoA kinase [Virgibacillus]NAZ08516.1 dephospho-CoA kinase [Agaribacter marinus]MBR7795803.1 dephospho-CoA kinase [Virgibacillus salarius]MCC2250174.1 dephospho-CoA kinase [Virgibacillus sp. AGTR]MDY7044248.1 dephospho-CoA kinase [Virgibacillus sp. M23]QRZ17678.1 dephospho-CoA kinase [Virgibacillus sp. AGTR]
MALIIGLTGSIASGKSTVSLMFDDHNIPVVDADKISREVVNPGEIAYDQIIEAFGKQVLREDKTLNREKLGEIIFADEAKRKQLNDIVHPAVREKMLMRKEGYVKAGAACVVLDIPLLFESKLAYLVDKTIVVYVDEHVQIERLMKRNGYSEKEAKQRIASQIPVKEKAAMADAVIDNNGTKHASYEQLEEILRTWGIR